MLAIDFVELFAGCVLAIEELQHRDSGDVLLQVGVDLCDGDADSAVAAGHGSSEKRW